MINERTEAVTLANMCMVFDHAGNVLVENKVHERWGGLTFPGGHIEKGESPVESVIREVYEETGLTIRQPIICGTKDWAEADGSRYLVVFYKTDQYSGTIQSSDEGEVKWMPLEEMKRGKLANGMAEMLRVFLEDELSEMHYSQERTTWELR